jgi:Flp pilus assembly protein TadD
LRQNHFEEAVFHARKALQVRRDSADARSNLGLALLGTGQKADARIEFQKVIETSPTRPRVHYNLATLLLDSGQLEEAIAEFQKELEIQPEFVEAQTNLGIALEQKERI